MDERMREVAQAGDVLALHVLIQENPFVLESIDKFPFIDTPLHIAAFEGHVDFAMEMMNLKPSYARKLNQAGFSPMHLALLNHQTLAARELLKVDKDLVCVKGRGGLTPLHVAAEKGNLDLIAEFLEACPECITNVTIQNQTALHIVARNNSFETLELLVCWLQKTTHKYANIWNKQVLNQKDQEGNTVLHIAASINQPQMARLLLKCKVISKNEVNLNGHSALDMLQGQVNNSKTAHILRQAGCMEAKKIPVRRTLAESLRLKMSWPEAFQRTMVRQNNKVSSDMRNALLVVAVLILTATYQACLSPPGGVWQGDFGDNDFGNPTPSPSPGDSNSGNPTPPSPSSASLISSKNDLPTASSYPLTPKTEGVSSAPNSVPLTPKIEPHHILPLDKVGLSVLPTPNFVYFYIINTATFFTTTCVVLFLLSDQTINLLTVPVLLFILCYLLLMMYLAPFPIVLPFFPLLQPIFFATLVFLLVCLPKFFNLNLKSQGASSNVSAY